MSGFRLHGMIAKAEIVLVAVLLVICIAFRRLALKSGAIRQTRQARLIRVKNAGLIFMVLMAVSLPLGLYCYLGFLFGWDRPGSGEVCRMVVLQQVYSSPAEMPEGVIWPVSLKKALEFFAVVMLLRLFWLYSRGILFSDKNITCFRVQGYVLIINCFIDLELQRWVHASEVSLTPVLMGFLIIFVAWIMDEGRKIQEEQELTV